jgi:hypothetical protein
MQPSTRSDRALHLVAVMWRDNITMAKNAVENVFNY